MIGQNIKLLRKRAGKSQEEVAQALGLTRSSYSGYENGVAEPNISTLKNICKLYGLLIDDLVNKDFSKFTDQEWKVVDQGIHTDLRGSKLRILTAVVDQNNEELIEMVPQAARAGYVAGYADPDYIKVLPTFSLPFLSKNKKYRSFPIEGDSMPPVSHGSYVTAEFVQNWELIKNGTPCIVVTQNDGIVFKVVNNFLESHKSLQLCSTNPQYPPYMVHANDILEVWKFVNYISKELPDVEVGQSELTKSIKSLQQEVNEIKTMMSR
jgi:transcriptional regulator with XRE-family HTH domain